MPSTPVPSGNVALRVPADASNVRQRRHELEDGNRIGSEREEIAEHPPLVDRKWRGVCQHGSNRVRVAVDVGQQPESHDALPYAVWRTTCGRLPCRSRLTCSAQLAGLGKKWRAVIGARNGRQSFSG